MTQTLTTETFTNEQLRDIAEGAMLTQLQDKIMARELLANREAQPVGYIAEVSGNRVGVLRGLPLPDVGSLIYTAPPAPAVPEDYQHLKNVQELYHGQEERLFALAKRIKGDSFDKYAHSPSQAIDVLEKEIFGEDKACRDAMLAAPEGGNG